MNSKDHPNQENSSLNIGVILLAAGSSSRMGQSKQMLNIEGVHLLLRSTNRAVKSEAKKVIVVLGANELAHRKIIDHLPVEIITNSNWQKGMGSSLKLGAEKLLLINPELDATIVMVCDQPLLTTDHLNSLIRKFKETKSPIVASFYLSTAGVPALFEKSLFEKLLGIDDESGAKKIIQQNMNIVQTIDFPEGAIDLDTAEDYQKLIAKKNA